MASLISTLPLELIENIIQHLDNQAISNLSKTCRAIYQKTQKPLYHNIHMVWKGNASPSLTRIEDAQTLSSPRIDLLLRTILEIPEYASHITTVSLSATGFRPLESFWFQPKLPTSGPHEIALFKAVLKAADFQDEDRLVKNEWRTAIETNRLDAITTLFLLQCRNITSLTLGIDILFKNEFLSGVILRFFDGQLVAPQKLRHVQLGCFNIQEPQFPFERWESEIKLGVYWENYMYLFFCPAIETAEIALCALNEASSYHMLSALPTTQTLQTLRLTDSSVSAKQLGRILSCTPMLTRLEYHVHLTRFPSFVYAYHTEAFAHVKNTLRHLKFLHVLRGTDNHVAALGHGSSFRDFPALVTLHIGVALLLGWHISKALTPRLEDVLPGGLEVLCLHDCLRGAPEYKWTGERVVDWLWKYLDKGKWRQYTPNLRTYGVVNLDAYVDSWDRRDLERLLVKNELSTEFLAGVDPECVDCKTAYL